MSNKAEFVIKKLPESFLDTINIWTRREGWNPGLNDINIFYKFQPQAFYGGFLNEELICLASVACFNDNYAFLGYYIVHPNYRNQGYGIKLTQHIQAVAGNRVIAMDGVQGMVNAYESFGFSTHYTTTRYRFKNTQKFSEAQNLESVSDANINLLIQYDANFNNYDRQRLFEDWIKDSNCTTQLYISNNKIFGYGSIRQAFEGWRIGPLFADSYEISLHLIQKLIDGTSGLNIDIDIPDYNVFGKEIVNEFKMKKLFQTNRMYKNISHKLYFDEAYGVMSLEFG